MDAALEPFITDELKADPVAWPILEKMPEKSVTDVLKGYAHSQHRLGSSINIPNGEAKPEDIAKWKEQHIPKLIAAKVLDAPRQAPDKYEVKLPDGMPVEMWKEEDTVLAQGFAKKHGLSQEALNDGIAVVASILGKAGATVQVDRDAQIAKVEEWAKSENIPIENVLSALDRFNKDPRGWDADTAEAISKSGYADNPLVVKAIYKLMKESGVMDTRNGEGATDGTQNQDAMAAAAEANSIIRDKANPKYAAYHKGDKDVQAYVEQLMKKGHPGTLEI